MNYFFFGDDTSMYLIQRGDAGRLRWYSSVNFPGANSSGFINQDPQNPTALPLPNPILQCLHVFAGGGGSIYAVQISNNMNTTGQLLRYTDTARNGSAGSLSSPTIIGAGWDVFTHIFCSGNYFYAVNDAGELRYYKYQGPGINWSIQGQLIGSGWNEYVHIFCGGIDNTTSPSSIVIYAIDTAGDLWWYKHLDPDGGTASWANNGNRIHIGSGWNQCAGAFSDGNGNIYGADLDGHVWKSQVTNPSGPSPSAATRVSIGGVGFGPSLFTPHSNTGAIEGICWPPSVRPGEMIEFRVSCASGYAAEIDKLDVNQTFTYMIGWGSVASQEQPPPIDAYKRGCGAWPVTQSMYIPSGWAPGVYALKCTASGTGQVTYIPFTVKPAVGSESGKIALLVNVNTWNAYSTYGGVSNYPTYPPNAASTERNYIDTPVRLSLERPYTSDGKQLNQTATVQFDHLLRGEWWIVDWLQKNYPGQVDVYTDLDLHDGSLDLSKYKVLILSTHPEYWTDAEYNNTQHFLATGGSLLYLGGNGIYRRCVYEAASRTIIYLQDAVFQYPGSGTRPDSATGTGWQCVDVLPLGSGSVRGSRSEVYLLGVGGYINCPGGVAGLAYTVVTSGDPLLQGTTGSTFGATGNNSALPDGAPTVAYGGASNWEVENPANSVPQSALPTNRVTLASSGSGQADMFYFQASGGGWVFSVGSITFGGSLYIDANLQKVVKNMLAKCSI